MAVGNSGQGTSSSFEGGPGSQTAQPIAGGGSMDRKQQQQPQGTMPMPVAALDPLSAAVIAAAVGSGKAVNLSSDPAQVAEQMVALAAQIQQQQQMVSQRGVVAGVPVNNTQVLQQIGGLLSATNTQQKTQGGPFCALPNGGTHNAGAAPPPRVIGQNFSLRSSVSSNMVPPLPGNNQPAINMPAPVTLGSAVALGGPQFAGGSGQIGINTGRSAGGSSAPASGYIGGAVVTNATVSTGGLGYVRHPVGQVPLSNAGGYVSGPQSSLVAAGSRGGAIRHGFPPTQTGVAPGSAPMPPGSNPRRYLARIKSYNQDKGFGFVWSPHLRLELGADDVFVHKTEMEKLAKLCGGMEIPQNALVSFMPFLNKNGRPQVREMLLEPEEKGSY